MQPAFNSQLGMSAAPYIGIYGSPYRFAPPSQMEKQPFIDHVVFDMPKRLREEILLSRDTEYLELVVDISDFAEKTFNVIAHAWAFPETKPGARYVKKIEMGLFSDDFKASNTNSIAINHFSPQLVVVHPEGADTCLSPNNARFEMRNDALIQTGWLAFKDGQKSMVCRLTLIKA